MMFYKKFTIHKYTLTKCKYNSVLLLSWFIFIDKLSDRILHFRIFSYWVSLSIHNLAQYQVYKLLSVCDNCFILQSTN